MPTSLIYDQAYLRHDTRNHPESSDRITAILRCIRQDDDLTSRVGLLRPVEATRDQIERCHSGTLIDQVSSLCSRGVRFLDLDTAISEESFTVARLAAGAAITAVDWAFAGPGNNSFAMVRPPGHHATSNQSMGFCLFNNAAIGARHAQHRYGAERILIVDWDVHHGNGTQDIFYSDPSVFYFSVHQFPHYPGTGSAGETGLGKGVETTLNIPLPAFTPAREHREAFSEALKRIARLHPPDLVIISAGFDARSGDPLGNLLLEDADFIEMTREVRDLAERHAGGRLVSLLEGGYNLKTLGETVRQHVRALAE